LEQREYKQGTGDDQQDSAEVGEIEQEAEQESGSDSEQQCLHAVASCANRHSSNAESAHTREQRIGRGHHPDRIRRDDQQRSSASHPFAARNGPHGDEDRRCYDTRGQQRHNNDWPHSTETDCS